MADENQCLYCGYNFKDNKILICQKCNKRQDKFSFYLEKYYLKGLLTLILTPNLCMVYYYNICRKEART